ncbi:MAG: hypothetical protein Tsb0033_05670 [Winogradskyella sp.]
MTSKYEFDALSFWENNNNPRQIVIPVSQYLILNWLLAKVRELLIKKTRLPLKIIP